MPSVNMWLDISHVIETSMIIVQYDNDSNDDDIKLIYSFVVDFNANVTFEYLLLNAL